MAKGRDSDDNEQFDAYFPLYRYQDIKSFKPDPRHNLMGDGWLKRGGSLQLIGSTGIGKSIILLQAACSCACGIKFLGIIDVPKALKVLVLQAENDESILHRDIVSIQRNLKLPETKLQRNLYVRHLWGFSGKEFHAVVERDVDKIKPDVLMVDPYQSYVDGNINDISVFRSWIKPMDAMSKQWGFGLVISVHTGKPRDTSEWDARELVYLGAGTSGMANFFRSSCEVLPTKEDLRRFKLHFSLGAEYTGITKRDCYIEQSNDVKQPFWSVSKDQSGDIVRVDYGRAIRELALEHKSWSMRQIAAELHVSVGKVSKWYPDELRKGGKACPSQKKAGR